LCTPPLRELTPETSYGFDVIRFARGVLEMPLLPWQETAAIHIGELLPDGRPRFRIILLLVARQNGKTELLIVLILYWLYVHQVKLVLGTSTNLDYAYESWSRAADMTEDVEVLSGEHFKRREANGQQKLTLTKRRVYKIGAANRRGGRSLTIDRLVADELREQHSWDAWNAAEPACSPMSAQIVALSNAGDDTSVVLNSLRADAIAGLDPRLGLIEWSAPEDSEPDSIDAILQANPRVGHGLDIDAILGHARRAKAKGGKELTGYKTEKLCIRVKALDAAVDAGKWNDAGDRALSLAAVRDRLALCLDVAPDGMHATLTAAAVLDDGKIGLRPVAAWSGIGASEKLMEDLPTWLEELKPRVLGWFPAGPAAACVAQLGKNRPNWVPRGVKVTDIRSDVPGVCMAFAAKVATGRIRHSDDPLQNAHVTQAEKLTVGDSWRFRRSDEGHCDGAYAAAGGAYLAETMPKPRSSKSMPSRAVRAARAAAAAAAAGAAPGG